MQYDVCTMRRYFEVSRELTHGLRSMVTAVIHSMDTDTGGSVELRRWQYCAIILRRISWIFLSLPGGSCAAR